MAGPVAGGFGVGDGDGAAGDQLHRAGGVAVGLALVVAGIPVVKVGVPTNVYMEGLE